MSEKKEKAPITQRTMTLFGIVGTAVLATALGLLGYTIKTVSQKDKDKDMKA